MIMVVIAEDHPFLRGGREAVLRIAESDVVGSVGDGDAALKAIARHDPDVRVLGLAIAYCQEAA
jgi:DNA-binding NarL/FixJ family response regulator